MRKILAALVVTGLAFSLEACPKAADNNADNMALNEPAPADMNAVDMNATDMNATDMNATDMNAGSNAAMNNSMDQGSTDH
jgi:uncharacterized protein involved in copper resistance